MHHPLVFEPDIEIKSKVKHGQHLAFFQVGNIAVINTSVQSEFDIRSIQFIAEKQGNKNLGTQSIPDEQQTNDKSIVFFINNFF